MYFQNTRGGEAAHQRLTNASGIGSGFRRENQRFGDRFNIQRDDNLIGDFTGLPVAVTADEGDIFTQDIKQRLHASKHLFVAADHNRERAFTRANFAAGYRRIEIIRAQIPHLLCKTLGFNRRYRTHINDGFALQGRFGAAVLAKQHVGDLRGIRDHDKNNLGLLRDLLGGSQMLRALLEQFFSNRTDGGHVQRVARFGKSERHRGAHNT